MQPFPACDINHIGVRGGHGDRADRLRRFMIENGIPGAAVIVRLPNPAVHLAHVENIWLAPNSRGGARASATKGADHAPVQVLVGALWQLRQNSSASQKEGQTHKESRNHAASLHGNPLKLRKKNYTP